MTNSGCSRWVRRSYTEKDPETRWFTGEFVSRSAYPVADAKSVVLRGQILILGGSTPRGLTSGILRFDPA